MTTMIAKTILEQLAGSPLPKWHQVESAVTVKRLQPGAALFYVNEHHPCVHFVRHGVIKMVYETADGKDWIKAFAEEGRFFASLTALAPSGKTSFSAYAVCNTTIELLPYKTLIELAETHPLWEKTLRRALEIYGFRKETRERELLTMTPEERYKLFVSEQAHLAGQLSHKDIAGYIRVTPVALSRIKKRVQQAFKPASNPAPAN